MMCSEYHAISTVMLWLMCSTQIVVTESFTLRFSTKLGGYAFPLRPSSRLHECIKQSVLQEEVILDPASTLSQNQIDAISSIVETRAQARCEGRYDDADQLRSQLQSVLLPAEHLSIVLQDMPRSIGGGSEWSLVRRVEIAPLEGTTVLQLAHAALGLAIASSEQACLVDTNLLHELVQQAHTRLANTPAVNLELRGRKAADAAFWFTLAGVSDNTLLHRLADIAAEELLRFGSRDTCRSKDVWQILERFSAAGLKQHSALEGAAQRALLEKYEQPSKTVNLLNFFSDRCLLMIWKFSSRQRKQRDFLETARNHWMSDDESKKQISMHLDSESSTDWTEFFTDPTRPLVLDIGCGMGVSVLGLADQGVTSAEGIDIRWSACNFAGVDLSGLAINYAQCLSQRWHLNAHFFLDSAENMVEKIIATYPGPLHLCLIQFPTPYRLPTLSLGKPDERGNIQLPATSSDGFMVSERLLHLVRDALAPEGKLLVQSNCEDVAVWIRKTAITCCNFESVDVTPSLQACNDSRPTTPTKRSNDWIASGGERAQGSGWSPLPLLPRRGRTETEVACMLNGTPVHRCLLVKTTS